MPLITPRRLDRGVYQNKETQKLSAFVLFSFLATVVIDRAIGAVIQKEPVDKGLLFPPHCQGEETIRICHSY